MHLVAKTDLDRRIAEKIEPETSGLGLELVRVRSHESKETRIQIMAERREGNIDLDDCARLSKAVHPILEGILPGRNFALEVSSPGIDRPLTRLGDFSAYTGSPVRIETATPHSGRRRFRGTLLGIQSRRRDGETGPETEDRIAIRDDNSGDVLLPFATIAAARLVSDPHSHRRTSIPRKNRKH